MSTRYGLPTDDELRRLTRRKLLAAALAVVLAGLLSAVLAVTLDGIRTSTVLFVLAGGLALANLVTLGELSPRELAKREVLTAGSRRRRRRLRWALLRGRTDALSEEDRRIGHHLARVVRVRAWAQLLVNGTLLPAVAAYGVGMWSLRSAPPAWPVAVLALLLVLGAAETGLRVAETRAAARFLASHEL